MMAICREREKERKLVHQTTLWWMWTVCLVFVLSLSLSLRSEPPGRWTERSEPFSPALLSLGLCHIPSHLHRAPGLHQLYPHKLLISHSALGHFHLTGPMIRALASHTNCLPEMELAKVFIDQCFDVMLITHVQIKMLRKLMCVQLAFKPHTNQI